jgi:hypothetical protein
MGQANGILSVTSASSAEPSKDGFCGITRSKSPFDDEPSVRAQGDFSLVRHCTASVCPLYERTNPLRLREEIYDLVDQIFALPNAVPGVAENVYQLVDLPRERQVAD